MDFKQKMAIINSYKKIIAEIYPKCPDNCGIYILTREENGFKYAYIGQAKKILTRIAQHLTGHQHIDLSLKSHKFYCENNKTGWNIDWLLCEEKDLDCLEQEYILKYHKNGYQLRNKTAGGQGTGKFEIAETRPKKGYYDGVAYGEKKTKRKANEFFEKYLDYSIKEPKNKIKERKFTEFAEFLKGAENERQIEKNREI